jgi:hypothetical protein
MAKVERAKPDGPLGISDSRLAHRLVDWNRISGDATAAVYSDPKRVRNGWAVLSGHI